MEILLAPEQIPADDKRLIESMLEESNLDFRTSISYKKAVEDLARFKNPIIFLYCFENPDDLTPAEAVRIMKEIMPNLLIVSISGETSLQTERELRKSGLYFHLSSPLSETELRDVLTSVIRKEIMGRKK